MLQTLLEILTWDLAAPEILLGEDGDLSLDWHKKDFTFSLSIGKDGEVSWAGGPPWEHGKDKDRARIILESI